MKSCVPSTAPPPHVQVKDAARLEQEDTDRDKKRICARVRGLNAKRVKILEQIRICMEKLVEATLKQGLTHCNKLPQTPIPLTSCGTFAFDGGPAYGRFGCDNGPSAGS